MTRVKSLDVQEINMGNDACKQQRGHWTFPECTAIVHELHDSIHNAQCNTFEGVSTGIIFTHEHESAVWRSITIMEKNRNFLT